MTPQKAPTDQVDEQALEEAAPEPPEDLVLAATFATPSRDEWVAAVDEVLRRSGRVGEEAPLGAGVEKLAWATADGVTVQPLYTAADVAAAPRFAPSGERWDVRQHHAATTGSRLTSSYS